MMMKTIQWPEATESSAEQRPGDFGTILRTPAGIAVAMAMKDANGQTTRRRTDVLVTLVFAAILVLLGVSLLFYGPLPQIFPAIPGGGVYFPR